MQTSRCRCTPTRAAISCSRTRCGNPMLGSVSRGLPGLRLPMLGIALLGMPALGAAPPAPGQSAPPLVGRTFSGAPIDLATFRGRVVALNFWASWCVPCRAEMPDLEALYRDLQDQGVTVIGLSADDRHDRAAACEAAGAVSYPLGPVSKAS